MDYTVVYDAAKVAPEWWFPALGLVFIAIGLLLWRFRHRMQSWWHGPFARSPKWITGWCLFWLGFSIVWTTFATISVFGPYFQVQRALRAGSAAIVEGPVEDFHPMPYNGHDTERFTVQGVHFAYSDFIVGAGFNHASAYGGPIRPGLFVRIHYVGPAEDASILKLEIKE